jgi:hypothetical protein
MIALREMAMLKRETTSGVERFRKLALALPGAVESSHMGAADFRIEQGSKQLIFATLAYAEKGLGTLKLTAEQQESFLAEAPEYFSAAPGGWGRMGMTLVRVDAPESVVAGALATAHRNVLDAMTKKPAKAKSRA